MFMVLRIVMRAGRGGGWGGGGPWGGSRGRGPYGTGGWPSGRQPGSGGGWPNNQGNGQPGNGGAGWPQGSQPGTTNPPNQSPGNSTPSAGGMSSGSAGGQADGQGGWNAGGGPEESGWATTGSGGSGPISAGSGQGTGERLAGAGWAWPGEDSRDWMNDPRPAAASVPPDLFPQRRARTTVQAASPLDAGLAAIKSHDPAFDMEQFLQQVQRVFYQVEQAWSDRKPEMTRQIMADDLWLSHRAQMQAYIDGHKRNMRDYLTVSNVWPVAASSDSRFDTITVRIAASSTDYDVDETTGSLLRGDRDVRPWQEDWTFRRSSNAKTQEGGPTFGSRCPNCGALLDVDLMGSCRYCKAAVMTGEHSWVLARISRVG